MLKKVFPKKGKICKATFSLPKQAVASAKKVALLGEFNNWDQSNPFVMKKKKNGSFETTIELKTGKAYQFRYLIDNQIWENDWAADQYAPVSAFGIENSVIQVSEVSDILVKKKAANKATLTKNVSKKIVTNKATKEAKSKKDDLKKIEGIGPKIAEILAKAKINSFEDLSKTKVTDLRKVLASAGPRYQIHNPSTWSKQAKLAAKADWAKLTKLQDELKGGVKK